MEKYLWLEGDEGEVSQVTEYASETELVEAVRSYLVSYYTEFLEGDPFADARRIERVKEAVTLKELYNLAEGFYWGANDCKVFNFLKIIEGPGNANQVFIL